MNRSEKLNTRNTTHQHEASLDRLVANLLARVLLQQQFAPVREGSALASVSFLTVVALQSYFVRTGWSWKGPWHFTTITGGPWLLLEAG